MTQHLVTWPSTGKVSEYMTTTQKTSREKDVPGGIVIQWYGNVLFSGFRDLQKIDQRSIFLLGPGEEWPTN